MIESFSPRDVAESIIPLLGDPERRADIGTHVRARVTEVNAPARISSLLFGQLAGLCGR